MSGGFYKYRCKYFYTYNCPNWVWVSNSPCAPCVVGPGQSIYARQLTTGRARVETRNQIETYCSIQAYNCPNHSRIFNTWLFPHSEIFGNASIYRLLLLGMRILCFFLCGVQD